MTNIFKPVSVKEKYVKEIAHGIQREIFNTMFEPVFKLLDDNSVLNYNSALSNAITSGVIYYEDGAFKSDKPFSNTVAGELEKLGAKYRHGAYYIEKSVLPVDLQSVIATRAAKEALKFASLNGLLVKLAESTDNESALKFYISEAAEDMFKSLQADLEASTSKKSVPVIDMSADVPRLPISETVLKEIDDFHLFDEDYDKLTGEKKNKKGKNKGKNKGKENEGKDSTSETDSSDKENKDKDSNPKTDDKDKESKDSETSSRDSNTDAPQDKGSSVPETKSLSPKINLDEFELDKSSKKIAEDYVYNMDYWVKNWKTKEIIEMRRTVADMVQKGKRLKTIRKYFETRWGIAGRKAEFLARNESRIASSVIKATHYQKIGCTHFKWIRSTSKEKRELHLQYAKKKNNQYGINETNVFSFANPPIIEQIEIKLESGEKKAIPKPNGQKGLPGQTYNCSCNLVGVVDPQFIFNRRKIENAKKNIFTKIKNAITNSLQRNNNTWRYRRFGERETF